MTSILAILPKLTVNGAVNIKASITKPSEESPDAVNGGHRLFTGLGKWTSLAALGVAKHLISLGLAEWRRKDSEYQHQKYRYLALTPFGREVAAYLHAFGEDLPEGLRG